MAGLPNAELRFLEGTSASLFFEHTDEVVADLVEFVTGVRPQAVAGASSGAASSADRAIHLTPRETDVLRLIAAGETNAEIAARLAVTDNTVERHVTNLYRKIDARGRGRPGRERPRRSGRGRPGRERQRPG